MNDGVIPSIIKNEGFLNDTDREYLKENGIEIAKGSLEQLYENQFNLYKVFSNVKDKLFLSYPTSDKEGKSLRHSTLITRIKNMFKNINIDSDVITKKENITLKDASFDTAISKYKEFFDTGVIEEKWLDVLNWYYINENEKFNKVIKGLDFKNTADIIDKESIRKLYGKSMKTSISKLEQYRSCPFSFHLKYGLKIKEKEEFEVRSIDTGSFMHDVIDSFFKVLQESDIKLEELEEDELNQIVDDLIKEKLQMSKNYILVSTPKFVVLTKRLSKVVKESIFYIVEQLKNSKFKIKGHEVEFKDNADYKPILITLDTGEKVELTGKIDRVDEACIGDNKYVRIIDYKSSTKNLNLNKFISGLQIQLISYLDAITENEKVNPAGVLYFGLNDSMIKASKNMTDEELKDCIRKAYKMNGYIVADIDIIKAMDTKLDSGYSDSIPVYLSKDEKIVESKSKTISKEKFEELQKYAKKLIKEISTEILSGNINIKPYYLNKATGCDYCTYKSICGFDMNNKGNDYNFISSFDKDYLLDMIEEKNKNE